MSDTKNLYQRLLAITDEVGKIEKTGRNQQQNYAFIEQAQLVATLRPLLVKHGVVILPEALERTVNQVVTAKGSTMTQVLLNSCYTLVNADNPEDRISLAWDAGEALDTSDKASNKATTAANKYFLMRLFNISDKDDPDHETHDGPAAVTTPVYQTTVTSGTLSAGMASDKQLDFIKSRLRALEVDSLGKAHKILSSICGREVTFESLTKNEAKTVLDKLLAWKTPSSAREAMVIMGIEGEHGPVDEAMTDEQWSRKFDDITKTMGGADG